MKNAALDMIVTQLNAPRMSPMFLEAGFCKVCRTVHEGLSKCELV